MERVRPVKRCMDYVSSDMREKRVSDSVAVDRTESRKKCDDYSK